MERQGPCQPCSCFLNMSSDARARQVRRATLVIPRKDGAVLLARKARGFGKGKWVGFGGKVERDETVEQANVREIAEETGVRMQSARKMGLVMFTFDVEPELFLEVHVFDTDAEFDGVKLNDEYDGDAVWYPFDKIPFEEMWPDFRYWSDHLLAGRRFHARIHYADFATVKTANVRIVGDDDPLHSVDSD